MVYSLILERRPRLSPRWTVRFPVPNSLRLFGSAKYFYGVGIPLGLPKPLDYHPITPLMIISPEIAIISNRS
jgi:hypothetical protein